MLADMKVGTKLVGGFLNWCRRSTPFVTNEPGGLKRISGLPSFGCFASFKVGNAGVGMYLRGSC